MAIKKIGILVGGGPAPGINGVIRSVTIEAINAGISVVGIFDGFSHLMKEKISFVKELSINQISRIHNTGGSFLRTSRANPTKEVSLLQNTLKSIERLGIDGLITIGGDDTAYTAYRLKKEAGNKLHVAHVPKTIDNDLPLPNLMATFGFHTARHYGAEMVSALMVDAQTTVRWYFVVTMGRKAGHLAIGIGKAAGATITIIGEEFRGKTIHLDDVVNVLEGAIIKRLAMGRPFGVAVLAEGLSERIDWDEIKSGDEIERDDHGNVRLDEIDLGGILKNRVKKRFKERGVKVTVVAKNVGYELRCRGPVPFDCEYTQDLGYAAVRYLIGGGEGAIVSIKRGGKILPLLFEDLIDPKTKKMSVRLFDINSDSYKVARSYMIRIEPKDFENPEWVNQLAAAGKMSEKEFRKRFGHLV